MADKAHRTRQKLTFRIAPPKPRNPLVAPALKRVAGPHRKSPGGRRVAAKDALLRTLKKLDDET